MKDSDIRFRNKETKMASPDYIVCMQRIPKNLLELMSKFKIVFGYKLSNKINCISIFQPQTSIKMLLFAIALNNVEYRISNFTKIVQKYYTKNKKYFKILKKVLILGRRGYNYKLKYQFSSN